MAAAAVMMMTSSACRSWPKPSMPCRGHDDGGGGGFRSACCCCCGCGKAACRPTHHHHRSPRFSACTHNVVAGQGGGARSSVFVRSGVRRGTSGPPPCHVFCVYRAWDVGLALREFIAVCAAFVSCALRRQAQQGPRTAATLGGGGGGGGPDNGARRCWGGEEGPDPAPAAFAVPCSLADSLRGWWLVFFPLSNSVDTGRGGHDDSDGKPERRCWRGWSFFALQNSVTASCTLSTTRALQRRAAAAAAICKNLLSARLRARTAATTS